MFGLPALVLGAVAVAGQAGATDVSQSDSETVTVDYPDELPLEALRGSTRGLPYHAAFTKSAGEPF